MLRLLLLCLAALLAPAPAARAQGDTATLLADAVSVSDNGDTIAARGNVEVFYRGQTLTAAAITYDRSAGTLRAEGPIRLQTAEGVVLLASLAELSDDLSAGLIEGARLILDQRLQIAAVEGRRVEGRYITLDKVMASSCTVCPGSPTPIWRIRARRVIHDADEQRIWFEGAWFDLYGFPIAYIPTLRIPEPGVGRATGFLLPTFSGSDIFGYGVKLPYYITLGNHADMTLTPFLTTGGAAILEGQYRHRMQAGELTFNGAFSLDDGLGSDDVRGFVDATGRFDLPAGFQTAFRINRVSDATFLQEFDYSDADRLTSFATVNRYEDRRFVELRTAAYQSLRDDEPSGDIPLVLPEFDYRQVWYGLPGGGRLGVTGDGLSLLRREGRDMLRVGGGVDWRRDATLANGMQLAALGDVLFDAYQIEDDPDYDADLATRLVPTLGAELRWPLGYQSRRALHVIEPVAQVLFSDSFRSGEIPNEDSLLPEFDETSLFALNRFPGRDAQETGARANIGLSYTRFAQSGWEVGVTLGQIFRKEAGDRFSLGSGLAGASSDMVAAVSFDLPPRIEMTGRALFAPDDLMFRRGELEFAYTSDPFDLTTSYVYLAADPSDQSLNLLPERQEYTVGGRYRIAPSWEITGAWRYDIAEARTSLREAGLSYGNECIEVNLSLSRRLATSNNVPTSTNIGLSVNLAGLGSASSGKWPARKCTPRIQ